MFIMHCLTRWLLPQRLSHVCHHFLCLATWLDVMGAPPLIVLRAGFVPCLGAPTTHLVMLM